MDRAGGLEEDEKEDYPTQYSFSLPPTLAVLVMAGLQENKDLKIMTKS